MHFGHFTPRKYQFPRAVVHIADRRCSGRSEAEQYWRDSVYIAGHFTDEHRDFAAIARKFLLYWRWETSCPEHFSAESRLRQARDLLSASASLSEAGALVPAATGR